MEVQSGMRGFSYIPKKSMEFIDLKYVEKDELEQTWKMTRRQRLKQQEQKIWEQFVQEQDIVTSICKDDPYQFLHQLPESCIKELLEEELQKMRNEHTEVKAQQQEQEQEAEPAPPPDIDNQHVVTFVEEEDREDMFHIFDDEKDDEVSGPEEEVLNDSAGSPPCTVRERRGERGAAPSPVKSLSPDKASSKSSENVSNMIESSIYCAKVKELRMKINKELLDIVATLERVDVSKIEPEEVPRLLKRAGEFCARFNRVYLYQLHRQVSEVVRGAGAAAALPFARHTQFQSQMVRVVSLHQNLLQTAQVFHKSIGQTACARDSGEALRTLLRAAREADAAARATAPPADLQAAQLLYNDDIEQSCSTLEECLDEYTKKLQEYLDNLAHTGKSRKGKFKGKKRSLATWSKSGTKSGSEPDGRLSMYSLDTLRLTLHSKSTISKGHSSGTSKVRGGLTARRKPDDRDEPAKSPKKSPKSRRPLMRDPAAGKPRRALPRELDVPTLVETIAACTSSHISREGTPRGSQPATPRGADGKRERSRKHSRTPRKNTTSPKKHAPTPDKPDDFTTVDVETNVTNDKMEHEIKVELKPKSPEKIIESTLRAAKEHNDSARTQKHDAESKCHRDSPKKCEMGTEARVGWQEAGFRVDREAASPRKQDGNTDGRRSDRDKYKVMEVPGSCEVSRLLRQLCGGDASGGKTERVSGTKNAQLLCVNSSGSPRQPSTPQLLRILEETIQKKAPRAQCARGAGAGAVTSRDVRLALNIPERTADCLLRYRTQFVQHMLTSSMYANSAVGKPWEMIGSISDQIIDELLLSCAKEMELRDIVQELYASETR